MAKIQEIRKINHRKDGINTITLPSQWVEAIDYLKIQKTGNQIILTPIEEET